MGAFFMPSRGTSALNLPSEHRPFSLLFPNPRDHRNSRAQIFLFSGMQPLGINREYIYLNGQPIAQINADESITYLHTDHLGTPRIASDSTGASVWAWDSDAFGVGAPSGTATVNLRFAGQYYDDESGLHYNWNRYYDPETGRYISSDPIGLAGGLNTFAYTGANPVMYVDPEGTFFWFGPVLAGAGSFGTGYGAGETLAGIIEWWNGKVSNEEAARNIAFGAVCTASGMGAMKLANKFPVWKGPIDYSDVHRPRNAGNSKDVTAKTKKEIWEKNIRENGGVARSDKDGIITYPQPKSEKGVPTNPKSGQVDHKKPKNKGGTNCPSNLQILTCGQNREKSDKF